MDASVQSLDMVKFVLGDLPLARWDDITDEQRFQIVAAVSQRVRPLLKVLPGFKTLREWLEEELGVLLIDVTQWFGSLDWNTHCRLVLKSTELTVSIPEAGVTEKSLVLADRDGNWLVMVIASKPSYFATTTKPQPRPFRVTCCRAGEDLMQQIASKHGRDVYLALNEVLNLAISYWSHRIVDCEEVRDWIADIDSRVM